MFDVEIRTADPDAPGIEPGTVVVHHHLTDRAQITVDTLSGGHLLHLAVAGCLFNDILRAAGQRGIPITDLRISADGGFVGDPLLSTGVHYSVTIAGDAPDDVLRALVVECQDASAVAQSLRRGTPVEAGEVRIR
jgi:uncharacterized OsmC-like protein